MRAFEIAKGFEKKGVILPTRSTVASAGYDLRTLEGYTLKPNETHIFETGLKARMEKDEVLLLFVRSSVGIKKGLSLANGVAVIDSDYYGNEKNDGHIMVALLNRTQKEVVIEKEERIVQGVFVKYLVTDDDDAKGKRTGGVGSTN